MAHQIRQATTFDLPEVIALENEAFGARGTAESPAVIQSRIETFPEGCVVIETDGKIIGYSSSEKWLDEQQPLLDIDASARHHTDGKIFCISSMAIFLAYRGQGFGLALLDHLIKLARHHSCTQMILSTVQAQEFYSKRGFRITDRLLEPNSNIALTVMKLNLSCELDPPSKS